MVLENYLGLIGYLRYVTKFLLTNIIDLLYLYVRNITIEEVKMKPNANPKVIFSKLSFTIG